MSSSPPSKPARRKLSGAASTAIGPIRWSGRRADDPDRLTRVLAWVTTSTVTVLARFPWRFAVTLSVVPALILGALVLTVRTVNQDVVYPRVRVDGAEIGGLGVRDAREVVARAMAARLQSEIVVRAGDQTWRRTLTSLGLGVSDTTIAASVDDAWKFGHRATWREWWADVVLLIRTGATVPPNFTLDRQRAREAIGSFRSAVERDPVDAEIVLVQAGDGYEVHLTPAISGVRVDVDATTELIRTSAATLPPGTAATVVEIATIVTQATVSTEALRAATAAATALVDDPIELVDPDDTRRRVVLEPPAAHAMLQLGRSGLGVVTSARLDPLALRAWVQEAAQSIVRAPKNPRVAMEGGRLVVAPGVPGRRVDVDATARRIEASLTSNGHSVPFAVVADEPWVPQTAVEDARAQIDRATRDPITLLIPVGATTLERRVGTEAIHAWLALPDTDTIPRDTSTLTPASRPRLEWSVDADAARDYVARSVSPLVASSAMDPRVVVIARVIPATAAPVEGSDGTFSAAVTPTPGSSGLTSKRTTTGAQTPSSGARTAIAAASTFAAPIATPSPEATLTAEATAVRKPTATTIGTSATAPPSVTVTPTIGPMTYAFEAVVVPGRPGRAVDVEALAKSVNLLLHADVTPLSGVLVVPPTATPAATSSSVATGATPTATRTRVPTPSVTASTTSTTTRTVTTTATSTPSAALGAGVSQTVISGPLVRTPATAAPTAVSDRRVTIQVVEVSPNGDRVALAKVARTATVLISAPVVLEWSNGEWWIETNDLVDLLRFGPVGGDPDAYLGRDGLFAIAERVGREVVRLEDAPRDAAGQVLSIDVPQTAAAIWAAANRNGAERRAEFAWVEDDPTPIPGVTTPELGPPTATRTPVRNPSSRSEATPSPTPTATP